MASIPAGDYQARLQAIGTVNGSTYIFGQTAVVQVIVP
jgi:hypothetical protein